MATSIHLSPSQAGAQITRHNLHWGSTALGNAAGPITFGFRLSPPFYNNPLSNEAGTFSAFNSLQMQAAETVMRLWSDMARITFSEVNPGGYTNSAAILFGNYRSTTDGASAFAFYPITNNQSSISSQGDVWLNLARAGTATPQPGNFGFLALLHEVGHAVGLEHPGDYNAAPGTTITYAGNASYVEDSRQYTVMSYFDASVTGANHVYGGQTIYPSTPLLHDIAAIQRLYGANNAFGAGDTTYGFGNTGDVAFAITSANQQVVYSIWDGGGNDTLDFSGYANDQLIDLNAGNFSNVGALTRNVSIAAGATIENALGGNGNDQLLGNGVANRLYGGAGDDTLVGNGGNDRLDGGAGVDTGTYGSSAGNFTITVPSTGSTITVQDKVGSGGTDTLIDIEKLKFSDGGLIDVSWFTKTLRLSHDQLSELIDVYVAAFNRAPDALGLAFWGSRLADGVSLPDIARSFFTQPEAVAIYGVAANTSELVARLYVNVLGRWPDAPGLAYWSGELEGGEVDRDAFLLALINGAKASGEGGGDARLLANKEAVGAYFALNRGLGDVAEARTVMAGVTESADSVAAAKVSIDALAQRAETASGSEFVIHLVGIAT
jgi:Ca2+-binding RTX toxin-like protein